MKLPHIFIFNLKNTIIGNTDCTEHLYYIISNYNNNIYNYDNTKDTIIEDLERGLLRPYFKEFIEFIKNKYKYIELYINLKIKDNYLYNIIKNIEKICSVKFHIKDFSIISNNNETPLSLSNIFDIIIDDLQFKYPSLSKNKKTVFDNQLLYINSTYDNLNEEPLCTYYNYKEYFDIQSKLINVYGIKEDFFDNKDVLSYFQNKKIPIYNKIGSLYQKDKIYQSILNLIKYKEAYIDNMEINDNYFNKLILITK